MGVTTQEPGFPVIDDSPSFGMTVGNFGLNDVGAIAAGAASAIPVGYFSGIRPKIAGPSTVTASLIGGLFGFMYAYQSSAGRLMGYAENSAEVKAYKKK